MKKNKTTKYFLYAFVILSCMACNANVSDEVKSLPAKQVPAETIQSFQFLSAGGDMGYRLSFQIRPDSTIYSLKNDMNAKGAKIVSEKTDNTFWQNLISGIDLDKVAEIKNGESRQPYDGTDTWLNIKTNIRTIAFVNGDSDTLHYPGVKILMDRIFNALSKYQATGQ